MATLPNKEQIASTARLVTALASAYTKGETAEFAIARDVYKLNAPEPSGLGVSLAKVASMVGKARARVAYPEADDTTLDALLSSFEPSRARMGQLALGYKLATGASVKPTAAMVAVAVRFEARTGASKVRDALVSSVAGQDEAVFIATVTGALASLATAKREAAELAEVVSDDQTADEGIGQDGSPIVPVGLSADEVVAVLTSAASRPWGSDDAKAIKAAMDALFDAIEAQTPALV